MLLYAILAINVLCLVGLGTFIGYSIGKGIISINYHKVMDKETSIKLAEQIQEEMEQGGDF